MARINLDDEFFCDPRIEYLAQISGEPVVATDGRLARLYHYCVTRTAPDQKAAVIDMACRWYDPTKGSYAELMVKAELANEPDVEGNYRIRGVVDAMQYLILLSATKKTGGEASAKDRPRDGNGRLLPKVKPASAGESSSSPPAAHQQPPAESSALTLTPSLTLDIKNKNKNKNLKASPKTASADKSLSSVNSSTPSQINSPAGYFIGTWVKAWQLKFGEKTRPSLTGRVQGQVKTLLRDVPIDRACALAQVYFQMDDPWFKTKSYDFGTFIENLNKVGLALDTGQSGGGIDWSGFGEKKPAEVEA